MAAMVVVIHHLFLVSPYLAAAYLGGHHVDGALGWLVYSPLHLLWAGPEAVIVFFVLSGFVLARPYGHGRAFDAGRYYVKRVLRLYLPVWAAVGVALALHHAPHEAFPGVSWWLGQHTAAAGHEQVVSDLALIWHQPDGSLTTVLWSLRWEVYFSLGLPLVLVTLPAVRRLGWGAIAALVMLAAASSRLPGSAYFLYLPAFVLGSVLAAHEQEVGRFLRRLTPAASVLATVAAGAGLTSRWLFPHLTVVGNAGVVASAVALVALALRGPFADMLDRRPVRWIGVRSFSLYLVHEPVLVAIALAMRARAVTPELAAVALPAVLVAAAVFYRFVEAPSVVVAERVSRPRPKPAWAHLEERPRFARAR